MLAVVLVYLSLIALVASPFFLIPWAAKYIARSIQKECEKHCLERQGTKEVSDVLLKGV